MDYYKFHVGDWRGATDHLLLEEEAIYLRLINLYYDTEQPLCGDVTQIARRIRVRDEETINLVESILFEFFVHDGKGIWSHRKCDGVITEFQEKSQKASQSSRSRRLFRTNAQRTKSERSTDEELTNNHKPVTSSVPKERTARFALPDWVNADAWKDFESHRKEMRKPLSDLARTKAANLLKGLTPEQQAECIDRSIQARWAGLFPEKILKDQGGKVNGKLRLPRDDDALEQFVARHQLPKAQPGETYPQWRNRINAEIEKRSNQ